MPYISVRGSRISYISGEDFRKSLPTVLMVHGAGQSSATWEYQVDILKDSPKLNLITPALPGHGKSEGNVYKSITEYTDFVRDFSDTLGLQKLIIVGHSMGGSIAQVFTIDYPERVYACVLVGTGARLRVAKETLLAVKNNYETFCEVAPSRSFASSSPNELKIKFREGLLRTAQEVSYWDLMACDEFDIMDEVGTIKVPSLIISGAEDILTPVKYGQYLNEKIQGSKFNVINNAGHFMMQEKPDEFNQLLLEFLDSL
ncbi:MAG: alpha/beta hydrolase [Deltaproteobacteria bacterium]|nr:alpha/beta hydrolase [Deltaproteobacteria bacterium]